MIDTFFFCQTQKWKYRDLRGRFWVNFFYHFMAFTFENQHSIHENFTGKNYTYYRFYKSCSPYGIFEKKVTKTKRESVVKEFRTIFLLKKKKENRNRKIYLYIKKTFGGWCVYIRMFRHIRSTRQKK